MTEETTPAVEVTPEATEPAAPEAVAEPTAPASADPVATSDDAADTDTSQAPNLESFVSLRDDMIDRFQSGENAPGSDAYEWLDAMGMLEDPADDADDELDFEDETPVDETLEERTARIEARFQKEDDEREMNAAVSSFRSDFKETFGDDLPADLEEWEGYSESDPARYAKIVLLKETGSPALAKKVYDAVEQAAYDARIAVKPDPEDAPITERTGAQGAPAITDPRAAIAEVGRRVTRAA